MDFRASSHFLNANRCSCNFCQDHRFTYLHQEELPVPCLHVQHYGHIYPWEMAGPDYYLQGEGEPYSGYTDARIPYLQVGGEPYSGYTDARIPYLQVGGEPYSGYMDVRNPYSQDQEQAYYEADGNYVSSSEENYDPHSFCSYCNDHSTGNNHSTGNYRYPEDGKRNLMAMIAEAIAQGPRRGLKMHHISKYIRSVNPRYRHLGAYLYRRIRYALIHHRCFLKIRRGSNSQGNSPYWSMRLKCLQSFMSGNFCYGNCR